MRRKSNFKVALWRASHFQVALRTKLYFQVGQADTKRKKIVRFFHPLLEEYESLFLPKTFLFTTYLNIDEIYIAAK